MSIRLVCIKEAINKFGEDRENAGLEEMQKLHDRSAFKPVYWKQLSREQKRQDLESLIFIKQKRCGRLKGRTCADGRKQRDKFTKEETSSPTVALELVSLTSVIHAKENIDVATLELPNDFIQTNIRDECVLKKLRRAVAQLMARLAPEKRSNYVTHENGKPILHV